MERIIISIDSPKCFGNHSPKNEQCNKCTFCFDCAENKTSKGENKYGQDDN